MDPIKTLDFGNWVSGSDEERQSFAKDLHDELVAVGFVKLCNHGISNECIDNLFQKTRQFFELPPEEKQKIAYIPGPTLQRGWSTVGSEKSATLDSPENISHDNLEDAKQHFDCGAAEDVEFPNKWPDDHVLPGFQGSVEEYFDKCQELGLRTMEALEMGFNLPQDALLSRFKSHASQFRLNHYPALPVQRLTDGLTNRLWPHADYGVLTFLVQDSVGGLQIWDNINQSGFLPIPCNSRYEIIVNAGGTLQRWTNDFLKAGLHRVVMPDANQKDGVVPERFSLAFFLHTARSTSAGPLPSFVDKDHPALYDEITTFEFERRRTEQTY